MKKIRTIWLWRVIRLDFSDCTRTVGLWRVKPAEFGSDHRLWRDHRTLESHCTLEFHILINTHRAKWLKRFNEDVYSFQKVMIFLTPRCARWQPIYKNMVKVILYALIRCFDIQWLFFFMSNTHFFFDIDNIAMYTTLIQNRHNIVRYWIDIDFTLSTLPLFLWR